jgi:hypothetical protein
MANEDFLARWGAANTKLPRVRLEVGTHELEVKRLELKAPNVMYKFVESEFAVIGSDTMKPGTIAEHGFAVVRPPLFAGDVGQAEDAQKYIAALIGAKTVDEAKEAGAFLLLGEGAKLQSARGMRIRVTVSPKLDKAGQPKISSKGFPVLEHRWFHVEQTGEQIAARRATQDATPEGQPAPSAAPPPAPETIPAPVAAPPALLAGLGKLPGTT